MTSAQLPTVHILDGAADTTRSALQTDATVDM